MFLFFILFIYFSLNNNNKKKSISRVSPQTFCCRGPRRGPAGLWGGRDKPWALREAGGSLFLTPICSPPPPPRDAQPWSRWLRSGGATRGASCTPASWTRTWWMPPIPWTPPSSVRQAQFHAGPWVFWGAPMPLGGVLKVGQGAGGDGGSLPPAWLLGAWLSRPITGIWGQSVTQMGFWVNLGYEGTPVWVLSPALGAWGSGGCRVRCWEPWGSVTLLGAGRARRRHCGAVPAPIRCSQRGVRGDHPFFGLRSQV